MKLSGRIHKNDVSETDPGRLTRLILDGEDFYDEQMLGSIARVFRQGGSIVIESADGIEHRVYVEPNQHG